MRSLLKFQNINEEVKISCIKFDSKSKTSLNLKDLKQQITIKRNLLKRIQNQSQKHLQLHLKKNLLETKGKYLKMMFLKKRKLIEKMEMMLMTNQTTMKKLMKEESQSPKKKILKILLRMMKRTLDKL